MDSAITADKATHILKLEVLMTDLSATVIELKFDGWVCYDETGSSPLESSNFFYRAIIRSLNDDKEVLGWKGSLFNIETNKIVKRSDPYIKNQILT